MSKKIKRVLFALFLGLAGLPNLLSAHGGVDDGHPEEEVVVQTVTQNSAGQKLGLALVSLVLIAVLAWLVRKFINKRDTNIRMHANDTNK